MEAIREITEPSLPREHAVSPLRVALFTDSDVFAGTERHIMELARGLKNEGVAVSIACPSASPLNLLAAESGIGTIVIEKRGLSDFQAIGKLRSLFSSGQIEVVHAHNGRTALLAAISSRLAGKGAAVATQHFIDPAHATRRGWRASVSHAAHRWVQNQTRNFIAVSRAASDAMLAREKDGLNEKMTVIPNGISPPDASALTPSHRLREEFGIPPNAPLIVCAARLEPEKDVGTLIAAMKSVLAEFPDARCVIAGEGKQRAALEDQIAREKTDGHVVLSGFRNDAISIIGAADIFVLPSVAEPFGLVLLEAMALGKPVVATAAGGPLEIVKPGETGLLVAPRDPAAMSKALLELLRAPQLRDVMGRNGRLLYEQNFTAHTMARATKCVYEKAAGK